MAELIDMFLFGLILKFYIPDFEYRCAAFLHPLDYNYYVTKFQDDSVW